MDSVGNVITFIIIRIVLLTDKEKGPRRQKPKLRKYQIIVRRIINEKLVAGRSCTTIYSFGYIKKIVKDKDTLISLPGYRESMSILISGI